MAVYYKFKSAKDYDSIPIDGHFISVSNLKERVFESKHLGSGTDFDLLLTNAQTNEEYLDEAMLIPKNTSVLIRRVPGRPRMTIVTEPVINQDNPKVENYMSLDTQTAKSSFPGTDSMAMKYPEDSEWDEFGNDLYAIPEVLPVQASNPIQEAPPPSKADEDSKIKAFIDTPALDWQRQTSNGFGHGRGFGRGMGGRGFGRGGLERKTPPQGYVCHRCKLPGHFIQHCATNGDPNFDVKRMKPPTGIPKSMLMATSDGSYALPSGAVAVMKPNEAAFEKEMGGLPSTHSVGELPPELHCPLCQEVMKDAVLTSKCCFKSFCDKCIRDHIMSQSVCICGATNILADDLLPNKTLRDTINRILEPYNSSTENASSAFQAQDMESKMPQPKMEPKIPSPTLSAVSKGEQVPPPQREETSKIKEPGDLGNTVNSLQNTLQKGRTGKVACASGTIHDSMSVKDPAPQGSVPLADEELQQKLVSGEAGKKKKKKKAHLPLNAAETQWKFSQDLSAENYMMNFGPCAYNPYWTGMQPGIDGYMGPYGGSLPHMGYGLGPFDVPFGALPHDPFGAPGYMMPPVPPQRDLANFGMGLNAGPPVMSREEFEARKADLRRKREIERWDQSRESSKDRGFNMEVGSSGDFSSLKSKSKSHHAQPSTADHRHRHRSERSPDYDHDHRNDHHGEHQEPRNRHRSESSGAKSSSATLDLQTKGTDPKAKGRVGVFSRISYSAEESTAPKKRGPFYSSSSSGASKKSVSVAVEYESSDNDEEDRHFKRRPSR